ncbi:MAG: XTP/dITP diphosphatase [Magnetococcales bacterium]|nr:XTP/dITP diphosphatase [Magnetococcales bacterium]
MLKIVLATRNLKKVEEIKRVIHDPTVELFTLADFPECPEVIEDGSTFSANAEKKAVEVAKATGCYALADDSGLVVDALDGAPGIYSARYAGEDATDASNLAKLLSELGDRPEVERVARFKCVISIATPDGQVESFSGSVEGVIAAQPHGKNGFGYDPVFIPQGHTETFAQMSAKQKDTLSHRGRALLAFSAGWKRP